MSKPFPKTTYVLALVDQPEDIFDVAFGADEAAVRGLLPSTTEIVTEGGFVFDAGINWKTLGAFFGQSQGLSPNYSFLDNRSPRNSRGFLAQRGYFSLG